jgi:hypothetical protein
MVIPIPSKQQHFKVKVGIRAQEPGALGIKCYDASKPNTDYIRRRVPFTAELFKGRNAGYKEFSLPFPLSPDQLIIDLYDKLYGDDSNFKIEKFELEKLEPRNVWAEQEMHRFIDFAQDFASKAGYIPVGVYDSKDGDFLIQYLPIIEGDDGKPLVTPARTNRKTGRIQAAQPAFASFTIPVRVLVLFHERYHYQLPTRLEKPADLHALRLYLDLGFPKTEAVYATTKIFTAHPDSVGPSHATRVKDNIRFIDDYSSSRREKFKQAI